MMGVMALAGAQQATPPSMARWSLRVEPGRCLLERADPPTSSILSIDTTPGSDNYRVAIVGQDVGRARTFAPATLLFGPAGTSIKGFASVAKDVRDRSIVWMQGLTPEVLDALAGAGTVTIAPKSGGSATVSIDVAAKAVDAIRRCTSEQLIEWGADPTQFAAGGAVPVPIEDRDAWITGPAMLKIVVESERADIEDDFRVSVSDYGVVGDCHAVGPQTEPGLQAAVCGAVEGRRLFQPARSAQGKAVRGVATFRFAMMRRPQ
jgi:hypothetical protein